MKFFKKKKIDDSRARRSTRLLLLRLQKFGLFTTVLMIIGALGFIGHQSGSFKKIGDWVAVQTLTVTANAGFRVKDILVTGREHIPAEELLLRLSIEQDMPIFGVSIVDAQKSLGSIPWVRDVSISRRLPDKIIIELNERTPAALWQHRQKISVIDREGVVLTSEDLDAWQSLPLIVGEDAPKHAAELIGMLDAEPVLAPELVSAVRVKKRRWDLHLQNGIVVKLPEQDTELALRRLADAEEQKNILARDIASIDLRQPERMMITPAAVLTTVPNKKNKKTAI